MDKDEDYWAALGRRSATRGLTLAEATRVFEANYVARAMTEADGGANRAAKIAGTERTTLRRMQDRLLPIRGVDTIDES